MIRLNKAGEKIKLSKEEFGSDISVTLKWVTDIDLDVHALIEDIYGEKHHCYFGNMNTKYSKLDQDAGIGDVGGDNEENMVLKNTDEIKKVLFYVEAFGKSSIDYYDFSPSLVVNFHGKEVKTSMQKTNVGKYFVIASINNDEFENINKVTNITPSLRQLQDYKNDVCYTEEKVVKNGLFSKILGCLLK